MHIQILTHIYIFEYLNIFNFSCNLQLMFYVFLAISLMFIASLVIKNLVNKAFCSLCVAVASVWLVLLFLHANFCRHPVGGFHFTSGFVAGRLDNIYLPQRSG